MLGLQEAVVPAVDAETVVKDRWDYSQHHLEFVTASPEHQLRIILDNPRLERPAVNADEEEENVLKALPPVTMKMLDDNTPTMHVPCTLQEPRIAYLNEFPAIGAYFAAAVKQKSGSFSSILAADTLVPHGSGQPVSSDDRDLIWELARAVASRLERYPAARIQARVEAFKYASLDEIRDAMVGLRSAQPAVTDTDEQPAHEEDAPGNTNAGEAEEGEDGNVVDNEMEEAEIDPEADSAEKAAHFGKLVRCDLRRFPGLTQVIGTPANSTLLRMWKLAVGILFEKESCWSGGNVEGHAENSGKRNQMHGPCQRADFREAGRCTT